MELLLELLTEIFGTMYVNFVMSTLPDGKSLKKWQKGCLIAFGMFISLYVMISIIIGAVFLSSNESRRDIIVGSALLGSGLFILTAHLIFYFVTKKIRKKQKEIENLKKRFYEPITPTEKDIEEKWWENLLPLKTMRRF